MKITLKAWQRIADLRKEAIKAVEALDDAIIDEMLKQRAGSQGRELLRSLSEHVVGAKADLYRLDVLPQSEWTGGDSDDPRNHKLREPNCCPEPRRYFTPEEMAAVGAACHGPCDWTFAGPPPRGKSKTK